MCSCFTPNDANPTDDILTFLLTHKLRAREELLTVDLNIFAEFLKPF